MPSDAEDAPAETRCRRATVAHVGRDRCRGRSTGGTRERGASLVEYAILVALIAVACIGALTFLGRENGGSVAKSSRCLAAAQDGAALPADC